MMLISGWIYHYGYMTGAGMMIAIILVGGAIGAAMETGWASRKRARAVVAAAALVVVSFSFGRPNDLYLGNCGWYDTDKDIYAIHGPCVKRIF
jgi:hypothetical protein